ncbi:uncharacterized protein LOC135648566 [Musa acuminata AAA Group]|uniref:uncharacterized protein LOC135648566 n=1 Tax=Musa acuminata AAA Group TaxID=214697 RepID=UPI0031E48F51
MQLGSELVKIFRQKFRVVWSNIWVSCSSLHVSILYTELTAGLLSSCLYNEQMKIPPSSCSFRDFLQVHDRVQDSCADGWLATLCNHLFEYVEHSGLYTSDGAIMPRANT